MYKEIISFDSNMLFGLHILYHFTYQYYTFLRYFKVPYSRFLLFLMNILGLLALRTFQQSQNLQKSIFNVIFDSNQKVILHIAYLHFL